MQQLNLHQEVEGHFQEDQEIGVEQDQEKEDHFQEGLVLQEEALNQEADQEIEGHSLEDQEINQGLQKEKNHILKNQIANLILHQEALNQEIDFHVAEDHMVENQEVIPNQTMYQNLLQETQIGQEVKPNIVLEEDNINKR